MNSERIESILNSGFKAVFVTAGGGSGALHALLSTPGASRFVTEAHVPYSPEALERFLGLRPEQAVSPETARLLAAAAFRIQGAGGREQGAGDGDQGAGGRGQKSEVTGQRSASSLKPLSIACTAALQTDRERLGDDRAFICIKDREAEKLYVLRLSAASRAEQEARLSDWLLVLIAQAVGAERGLLFPGSFNPVHQGHSNLLKVAEKRTGRRGIFELSCANIDKGTAGESDCLRRIASIQDVPVALTRAARFAQKAPLFPDTTFVLGFDTAVRLIQYARPGEWELYKALGSRFLVAGRLHNGRFETLANLSLPSGFEDLFEAVPESEFREDISSTTLRTFFEGSIIISAAKNGCCE